MLADLTTAIARPGNANDLTDALRIFPRSSAPPAPPCPRPSTPSPTPSTSSSSPGPTCPTSSRSFSKLGSGAGFYDFNGHYIRAQVAGSNLFDYNAGTEELDPIAHQPDARCLPGVRNRPYTRCPGGATQPNLGWPAPEDHPFLADGELAGDCDPTDVPPGP